MFSSLINGVLPQESIFIYRAFVLFWELWTSAFPYSIYSEKFPWLQMNQLQSELRLARSLLAERDSENQRVRSTNNQVDIHLYFFSVCTTT